VPLAPKVFETLLLLVEQRGSVVEKTEMINVLWPDRYVNEANLTQNIFTLRKLLGERESEGQYIETIPRRGYRFVAPVRVIPDEISPLNLEEAGEPDDDTVGELQAGGGGTIPSVAILPLVNETNDPEVEYLADGITESVINGLSRLTHVRVIARSLVFSYKGHEVNPQTAGAELGADMVLVGRILLSGGNLTIRIELVDVMKGWQIWGEQYTRPLSEVLTVEHELSVCISEGLQLTLTKSEKEALGKRYTQNPEAYQLFLKGRYYWNKRTGEGYRKAIDSFEQAINIDPNHAPSYSGLADSYVAFDFFGVLSPWEISRKAKAAALNALAIDDSLAEAHTSLACVKMMFERDWAGAEGEFKRAIELDPRYAHAHNWYSHFLMAMNRVEESFTESELAIELDPLDGEVNQFLGWHHVQARQFDRAITQLEKTLAANPEFFLARVTLGIAYVYKGDFLKGITEFQNAGLIEKPSLLLAFLGHAYAMSGQREEALKVLEELKGLSNRVYVPPYGIGLIYAALGDESGAFEWLERAYIAQNSWLNWIQVAPEVDNLRGDSRFQKLLLNLNLVPQE
jgi:TolB-like protein/DNA-binding winged helix-turn-helix (wHTH) protein/Tfp pilus assembly protein PilF